ncbi:hypothetical protein J1N35_043637 [Gossypium stocksii]|uniref:Transposase MuDR plant domain-containing protein n=1 Tax=Gossypium stocksii TaxID=47602 RepID=A0A9D3ZFN1_9ROSI|nr:hypothetical protein J1N35_043637 [Gossypium stocksii]
MSERISAVIYYDELHKRIRRKIFGTTPVKVLSIKYRFCAFVDPVTYDSFDIKGARGLEAMVQSHLASGAPYLQNTQPLHDTPLVDGICTSVSRYLILGIRIGEHQLLLVGKPYVIGDVIKRLEEWMMYSLRRPLARGPYVAADGRSDDESDVDPPREPGPDGAEVTLFSEPESVPTEPEGGSDEEEEEDLRFRAYSPPTHMHNVDLSEDDALEFPDLPHKRRDRASSSLDSGELEVSKEFSNKDSFLGALKQHSIMNGVNYNVVKSKSDKFEAKCAVKDGTCSWKIMASLRKKTGLWEIKKYKGPHTCVGGVSQDHPKMDSSMLASLILPMVKEDPRTSVPVLISHIRSQLKNTPSYRKAWIAKQKTLEKMHSGWDASYNEVW